MWLRLQVKSTDTFVTAFPKSGTKWVQKVVWNLIHNPNLENPKSEISIDARFPNIE